MKAQAKAGVARPCQIVANVTEHASPEVRARIGQNETMKRDLRRQKRGALPDEPRTLQDLVIDGDWANNWWSRSKTFSYP